ncbi:uncharacterized protein TNIN_33351 [Trichonephila inaurata madagascariensis]|uniref:Uncharacterized protein n=1 Tax=Trichonephila inaurata madagascariensis TaxID=2747483 RepID=A0A8X7BMB3_9ARAC|nr:uncharacterized protein TNIN_33351 [Trichonephila inaurata madagascariensis]
MIAKYIGYAIPKIQRKFILPILEKLRNANYTFHGQSELVVNGTPEYRSNAIDFFSSIRKNVPTNVTPTKGFTKCFVALLDSNIPLQWIGNKRLREQLVLSDVNPEFAKSPSFRKRSKEKLVKLYLNAKEPSSFGGVKGECGVHRHDVQKRLSQQDVFTHYTNLIVINYCIWSK